jgi:hypothetical protein
MGNIDMNFYKLTKQQADTLGRFEYAPNQVFDPYINDGYDNYYVSQEMYDLLKDTEQFKKLDFGDLPTVDKIDFKPIKL